MNLCDINEIRAILLRNGFRFSKALGQNFLTDPSVPARIAGECGAQGAAVLEVGPGIGCLTAELAKRAEKVIAVELDRALLPVLRETLCDYDNIDILQGDILKIDIKRVCTESAGGLPLIACANLPYYITTPAIAALFEAGIFRSVTAMVQKEVADRLTAPPGGKAYGAFTVFVNYYAGSRILFEVPADSFVPRPKVSSAVVRFLMHESPPACVTDRGVFFKVVKAAFSQRRKTLLNSLSASFSPKLSKDKIERVLFECGIDPNIRGERLRLEEFAKIADKMKDLII